MQRVTPEREEWAGARQASPSCPTPAPQPERSSSRNTGAGLNSVPTCRTLWNLPHAGTVPQFTNFLQENLTNLQALAIQSGAGPRRTVSTRESPTTPRASEDVRAGTGRWERVRDAVSSFQITFSLSRQHLAVTLSSPQGGRQSLKEEWDLTILPHGLRQVVDIQALLAEAVCPMLAWSLVAICHLGAIWWPSWSPH